MSLPIQRYKLTIAYRGTRYYGWQEQVHSPTWKGTLPRNGEGMATIQAICRQAIKEVVLHEVQLCGSSRTDARVHAKGQIAHFDTHMVQIPQDGLRMAVNARLPDDIVVQKIEAVPQTFDAILQTDRKRYQYLIWNTDNKPVFKSDLAFYRWQPFDLDAMKRAAACLVGTHDFSSFCKPGHGRATTVRTLHEVSISARHPRIVIGVTGSGFLWKMVRIIAGTLVEMGIGRIDPDKMPEILAACDRRRAGKTAPAHGLYLQWIKYRSDVNELHDERNRPQSHRDKEG